jgi:hypothetical protein
MAKVKNHLVTLPTFNDDSNESGEKKIGPIKTPPSIFKIRLAFIFTHLHLISDKTA